MKVRKRMLFVYNPRSGRGMIREKLSDILNLYTAAGYDVIVHPTQSRGDAVKAVKSLADLVDVVVCSGGDGTMDEVVRAIMNTDPMKPIGYIPTGSTNDFANSLGISRNPMKAAEDILDGRLYSCDVGELNSQYFVYVAAFGAFTKISYETDQTMKNIFGHLAYLAQAGPQVFNLPSYHVDCRIDDEKVSGEYTYGMITNARYVAGIKNITGPAVDMNDGLFEITLIHTPSNPIEVSEILSSLMLRNVTSPRVEIYKGSRISLKTDEKIDWTLDGEFGGSYKRVVVNNLHKKMRIYLKK